MAVREDETFEEAKKRRKLASRGKTAEKVVEGLLNTFKAASSGFDYDRLIDSRAAGKIMPPQVSDFTVFYEAGAFALEVKELKKSSRLNTKSAFPQFPRMLRRSMAGVQGFLLVHYVPEDIWVMGNVRDFPSGVKSLEVKEGIAAGWFKEGHPGLLLEEVIGWNR